MEIPEAQYSIWEIEVKLQKLIFDFEKKTGLVIDDVYIHRFTEAGIGPCEDVSLRVLIVGKQPLSLLKRDR